MTYINKPLPRLNHFNLTNDRYRLPKYILFLIVSAFQFSLKHGFIVHAQQLTSSSCLNSEGSCSSQEPYTPYSPHSPSTYDKLTFPYLNSHEYPCDDLEKFMYNQPQPTIRLRSNRPRNIAVVSDCNLVNIRGITHFNDFAEQIRSLLNHLKLSDPTLYDLIETLSDTFEFIVANKDKKGATYILIDLIKYWQLMQCEDHHQACIISDADNVIPEQFHFSHPQHKFHLGNYDSPEFMVTQKSNLNIGKSAILFSLARAVPYLKIHALHYDLDFKKAALDSTGHVLSILYSVQSKKELENDSFGPIIYNHNLLSQIHHSVSIVTTFQRNNSPLPDLHSKFARYFNENEGAIMFLNHAGLKTLTFLIAEHGINWDASQYIKIATKHIIHFSAFIESTISKDTLEFG